MIVRLDPKETCRPVIADFENNSEGRFRLLMLRDPSDNEVRLTPAEAEKLMTLIDLALNGNEIEGDA